MIAYLHYGGASSYVVAQKITRTRDTISVTYGEEQIKIEAPDGNIRPLQDRWKEDVFLRKNGLYRVVIEDARDPIRVQWDSDQSLLRF